MLGPSGSPNADSRRGQVASNAEAKLGVSANPYRSPSLLDEPVDAATGRSNPDGALDAQQRLLVSRGVTVTTFGVASLALVAAALLAAAMEVWGVFSFSVSGRLAMFFAPAALLIPLGVLLCNRLRGPHRSLGILASLLFAFGAAGTYSVCQRMLSGQPLLGLAPLFAASSFSTLLTALALVAIFYRNWARRTGDSQAALVLESAVLLLALSGVSVSLAVLWPSFSGQTMALLCFFGGGLAHATCVLVAVALLRLRRRLHADPAGPHPFD